MKDDKSKQLSRLTKDAYRLANRVLKPWPSATTALLQLDSERLLQSLQPNESLSSFHPFADRSYPMPAQQSPDDEVVKARAGGNPSAIQQSRHHNVVAEGEAVTSAIKPSEVSHPVAYQTVFNQNLSLLVEEVARGCHQRSQKQSAEQEQKKQAAFLAGAKPPKTSERITHKSASGELRQRRLAGEKPQTESFAGRLVFQQLSHLVADLERPGRFPSADKVRPHSTGFTKAVRGETSLQDFTDMPGKRHLADLTQVLYKSADSTGGKIRNHSGAANRAGADAYGKHAAQHPDRMVKTETIPTKTESLVANMETPVADNVKRNPNLSLVEQPLKSANQRSQSDIDSLSAMSPLATQQLADALNDYLQQQADLHGVDLT